MLGWVLSATLAVMLLLSAELSAARAVPRMLAPEPLHLSAPEHLVRSRSVDIIHKLIVSFAPNLLNALDRLRLATIYSGVACPARPS